MCYTGIWTYLLIYNGLRWLVSANPLPYHIFLILIKKIMKLHPNPVHCYNLLYWKSSCMRPKNGQNNKKDDVDLNGASIISESNRGGGRDLQLYNNQPSGDGPHISTCHGSSNTHTHTIPIIPPAVKNKILTHQCHHKYSYVHPILTLF